MNIKPTKEQEEIIESALAGNNLVINAFAGASKTTTCMLIAEKLRKPSLYIAFNKSIAEEAGSKFSKSFHVECRTLHSIAYEAIVKPEYNYRKKLQNWFDKSQIPVGFFIGTKEEHAVKNNIVKAITEFCQSDSYSLQEFVDSNETYNGLYDFIVTFWDMLVDVNNPTKITPDIYMKLFHLSKPNLNSSVIYLDEFQDSNPVVIDLVLKQVQHGTQVILVGDKYQAIYEWRGAVNGFDYVPDSFKTNYLTESFRLTPEIAALATKILSIAGEDRPIIGGNTRSMPAKPTTAVLCRGNATILSYLLDAAQKGSKVYCLADLKDLWSKVYHISNLYHDVYNKFPNAELARFKNYAQLKAEAEYDDNLARLIKLTITLSTGGLHSNVNKIKSVLVEQEHLADFTISTIHKSKGLEWDKVIIADDILIIDHDDEDVLLQIAESLADAQKLNLIYVAITRARFTLSIPSCLSEVLGNANILRGLYRGLIK